MNNKWSVINSADFNLFTTNCINNHEAFVIKQGQESESWD